MDAETRRRSQRERIEALGLALLRVRTAYPAANPIQDHLEKMSRQFERMLDDEKVTRPEL